MIKNIEKKQINEIIDEGITFAEITEKILTNPYQFNWHLFDKYSYNDLASRSFSKIIHLMINKDIDIKDLLRRDNNVLNHIKKILSLDINVNDTVYESYPDFFFEYSFLNFIKEEIGGKREFWEPVLWRIMQILCDNIQNSIRIENFNLYNQNKPFLQNIFDNNYNDKKIMTLFAKAFPHLAISTKNKIIFPYGVYTFRKLLQTAYRQSLKKNKNIYDRICKKYEIFANNYLYDFVKNDKNAIVIKNAIIRINKNKQKEVDFFVYKDKKITIFEHKGPISGFISDNKYFENIFKKAMKKSKEYQKLMISQSFQVLDESGNIKLSLSKVESKVIFTSLIEWGKGLKYDYPTISIGSIIELFYSYRIDTIKPSLLTLWDYINFKKSLIKYNRMKFNDYKSAYYSYFEMKGSSDNHYKFLLSDDKNKLGSYNFIDIEEPVFVFSNKQLFNYFMFNFIKKVEIYPLYLHQIKTKKVFGYTSKIPLEVFENLCDIGFGSNEALEYFDIVKLKYTEWYPIENIDLFLIAANLRLRGIEDNDTMEKLRPFYDKIKK